MANPKVNAEGQKNLEKIEGQIESFKDQVSALTHDVLRSAPQEEREMQTKIAAKDIAKADPKYIQPERRINSKEVFNEKYRKEWEHDREYVNVIAENNEIIGEQIELWTKKYAGDPAEFWKIPVNKPIWIPRMVAQRISECKYARLRTEDRMTQEGQGTSFYGSLVVEQVKNRLDCRPALTGRQISFASGF